MSDLADRHRRIADVVEPLGRMNVDASVDERETADGDLCLTLDLRIPPTLDAIDGGAVAERIADLESQCEQLREERDEARERVDEVVRRTADLEERIAELEEQDGRSDGEDDTDGVEEPAEAGDGLTDGQRETLDALRELGGSRSSGEIADRVDATLPSVRSWLSMLVQTDRIRAAPDPTDGRRKLYSPVEGEAPTDDEGSQDPDGTVYIASNGGSPSQVFHVRTDCPQLQKSADFVEKDRSVVPHHRPCGNCVPDGLEEGLVAIAEGSPTTTYHKRADCPKLGSAIDVAVRKRETVPNYDPCGDCVHLDREDDGPAAARICARNDLRREDVVEALESANAIYHVQRDLSLSRDETEALLRDLGAFEDLDGGGHVTPGRATSMAREGIPPTKQLESDGGETDD